MLILAALVTAFAVIVALANWRAGIILVLLIGVLQDVFRKLTPSVPAYYILWSAAVFGVVFLVAWAVRGTGRPRQLFLYDQALERIWLVLALVVALQGVHALLRWGVGVSTVGMVFYLAPVVALLVGLGYARTNRDLIRFIAAYALIMTPVALTVYLSLWYADSWPVLREIGSFVGLELRIYDVGTMLQSHSGLFRVGEIAAWHAATAASFLIILALQKPSLVFRVFVVSVVVMLVGAIILTGRRKMLMALTLFVVFQWAFLVILRRGLGRVVVVTLALGLIGSYSLVLLDPASEASLYLRRGATVYEEVGARTATASNLLVSAVRRSDGVGLGVGVAGQGSRYAGGATGAARAAGGAGEAGLGKIVLELGILGLLLIALLIARTLVRGWRILELMTRQNDPMLFTAVSLGAFVLANLATFSVATQVYGDPFVLLILGFSVGLLFALYDRAIRRQAWRARVAHREEHQRGNRLHVAQAPT